MSRLIEDLHPYFRDKASLFVVALVEARIPIIITDTLRTWEEHQANLARGASWTKVSLHLEHTHRGSTMLKGALAIDVVPYETYELHGPDKLQWNRNDPIWARMGAIGRTLGLKWGVWQWEGGVLVNVDPGHFEEPTGRSDYVFTGSPDGQRT